MWRKRVEGDLKLSKALKRFSLNAGFVPLNRTSVYDTRSNFLSLLLQHLPQLLSEQWKESLKKQLLLLQLLPRKMVFLISPTSNLVRITVIQTISSVAPITFPGTVMTGASLYNPITNQSLILTALSSFLLQLPDFQLLFLWSPSYIWNVSKIKWVVFRSQKQTLHRHIWLTSIIVIIFY